MGKEKVLLLGYGDIASRLVNRLAHQDYHIHAVRRSAQVQQNHNHVTLHQADCRDVSSMETIIATGFDVIVMTFTPTEMSDQGYKAAYVDTVKTLLTVLKQHALKQQEHNNHAPRLLLFVSSTSVYGQQDASWVDEHSLTEPTSYGGKRLLEAEQQLKNHQETHGQVTCCVRFSGIYGPGRRRLIEQVIEGKGTPEKPVLYSNRIHADDCAGVLAHLIEQHKIEPIAPLYIATDCDPVPLYDVKQSLAQMLNLPEEHLTDAPQPERMFRSSKRCSNQRLIETGYEFIYPTFKEGYKALLKEPMK